jgi:uncharacterized HAD superfamily protein
MKGKEVKTMRKLNLCIDIDGTVTEPYYWLEAANRYFGKQIRPEEITVYDIHKALNIEEADYQKFYDLHGQRFHWEAKARLGAGKVIQRLHRYHNIHFVTARDEKYTGTSIAWLAKHQIPLDTIWHLGTPDKANKARELKSDLFIEDSHSNAIQLAKAGFDVLLIDCGYNQRPLPEHVTRVEDWAEIAEIANTMAAITKTA